MAPWLRTAWSRSALLALLWAASALCADAPPEHDYEQRLVDAALARYGREVDPEPEGKRLQEILIASEDIIGPGDPYPPWLNAVHIKTRPSVIRKELLLEVGEPYRAALAEETERNLRALPILAVARVLAVKEPEPDAVGLLIVTKDLWSIRLNSEFSAVGKVLQYLRLHPTEQNFLGLGKQLTLDAGLQQDTFSFGEEYVDPRLFGSFHTLAESFGVIFNRQTGRPEGTTGSLSVGLPVYSLEADHGYALTGSWTVQTVRLFRGADIWQLPYPSAEAPVSQVPYVYDARSAGVAASYRWVFGTEVKTQLIAGAGGYTRRYAPPSQAALTPDERQWLIANYLPRSEDALYAMGGVQTFEARYARLTNYETFALSEDYQLGHRATLTVRWADPTWGSPTRFAEAGATARYRWLLGGDLLTVESAAAIRWMPGGDALTGIRGPWVNEQWAVQVLNLSPFLGPGRVVARAVLDLRRNDLNHGMFLLGGNTGLRGLPAGALTGSQLLLFNLEYRTRPIELYTLHAGLVAFWDAGSAFDTRPSLVHTVGLGIRALFPQFDSQTFRLDFGYVLGGPQPPFWDHLSASFGQIEDNRPPLLDNPLP